MALISILLPDLRGGGAERVSIDLAKAIAAANHQVEFILMNAAGDFLHEALRDFTVHDLGVRRTRHAIRPIAEYLRLRRPYAVIANMWPLTSVAVVGRMLSGHDCRLLVVEHNGLSKQYASWGSLHNLKLHFSMMTTYRLSDCVAAVSLGAAEDTARLAKLPQERVLCLHNPIPQRPFPSHNEIAEAETLWACPAGKRVIAVGSLKAQKNHALLLHAFANLECPAARLMLVGKGEKETLLRSLAAQLGIEDQVIFAGFHSDPSPFYATADLFVLSSDYEGFGNVIVEALSFGLPVVSTDCPSGPSEILGSGTWGRLVPVGDADALARAMREALAAPVDKEALIRRATVFSPEIAARKYLELLKLS
jgi:glycosyltransferase involved in cell wall biosynthesis